MIPARLALCLLITSLLAACATSYHPRTKDGVMGYDEQQTGPERWEIHFNAQRQTDWTVIDQFLQRRAGELATAQGWQGFAVVDQHHEQVDGDWNNAQKLELQSVTTSTNQQPAGNFNPATVQNFYQIPFNYRRGTLVVTAQH